MDGIKQFVSVNEEELIPQIDLQQWKELLTEEEQRQLLNKYFNIIIENTNKQAFSKQKNAIITIKEASIKVNAYVLTLTKEQFNDIYIKILEEAKQDETILSILQKVNSQMQKYSSDINEDFSKIYVEYISNKIEEIKNTNIGQEQRKIIVYQKDGQTVRLRIESDEYEVNVDKVESQNGVWIELYNRQKTEKENSLKINTDISGNENKMDIQFTMHKVNDETENGLELSISKEMENATINFDIEAEIYNEENAVDLKLSKTDTIVNELENEIKLTEDNFIDLNDYNEEQRSNIENALNDNVKNQLNKLQDVITFEDVKNILIDVDVFQKETEQFTDTDKVTETEKNRFNAKFEFFQSEELEKENVKEMIDVVKDHLEDVKIMDYKEKRREEDPDEPKTYLIVVKKEQKNEKLANILLEKIENEDDSEKYSIKIEYDEETGLVNHIILSINE